MHLSPREQERLLLYVAADVARRRRSRGLKLNYPEAVALLSAEILEAARDGRSVAEIMALGTTFLRAEEVMEGVAAMIREVQIEATFPDGTKLVTLHDPIAPEPGRAVEWTPGQYLLAADEIVVNAGRATVLVVVSNTGDRPIQVGSHFHFFEVNEALHFDRALAYGMRLDVPSGLATRFEPGDVKEVRLVGVAGARHIFGHRGMVEGPLHDVAKEPLP